MILGLIPARLKSTRLPEKPLEQLDGIPLIIHVYKRAKLSLSCDEIIVCTDSENSERGKSLWWKSYHDFRKT